MKPKIVADRNIPFLKGRLEKAGAEVLYVDQFGFTPENVKDADALLIRTRTPINRELLEWSRVRLVATATIGIDQIDLPYTRQAGVKVCNAPGCNAPGVAQYVWSALLRLGMTPRRHTIGVVGKGHVGEIVTHWGRLMGFKMLVCDPPRSESGEKDETYLDLPELLKNVDAITFHTPLVKSGAHPTFHLAGQEELRLLRDGAVVVNAARGPVVDNAALAREVGSGRLHSVVDTWEGEPRTDPLLLAKTDYGTFHIAGYSRQGKERATRMVLEAVAEELGLKVDTRGLEGPYIPPAFITPDQITASYDPRVETDALRKEPGHFDRLRNDYVLREEVKFD